MISPPLTVRSKYYTKRRRPTPFYNLPFSFLIHIVKNYERYALFNIYQLSIWFAKKAGTTHNRNPLSSFLEINLKEN